MLNRDRRFYELIKALGQAPTGVRPPRTNRCELCGGDGELTVASRTSTFTENCLNATNPRDTEAGCSFCSGETGSFCSGETGTHQRTEVEEEDSIKCPRCEGTGEEPAGELK